MELLNIHVTTVRSRTKLTANKQAKHEGLRFFCNQFKFKTLIKSYLKIHQQSKHDGIKFTCFKCELQVSTKSDLKRHELVKH